MFLTVFLIGIGLAMDAFAVSVGNGMSYTKTTPKYPLIFGCFFGFFQFMMPVLGFYGASLISQSLMSVGNFISFGLLALIGGKMLYEVFFGKGDDEDEKVSLDFKSLIVLSIATSIDALAVGVSFNLTPIMPILQAGSIIGITTFFISAIGFILGQKLGGVLKKPAKIMGGLILVGIGIKLVL